MNELKDRSAAVDLSMATFLDGDPGSVLGAFHDLYRILKPDTFCVSFYGWNTVAVFFSAWIQAGFSAVGHIVWHKNYSSRRGFLNAPHEQAYVEGPGARRRCADSAG